MDHGDVLRLLHILSPVLTPFLRPISFGLQRNKLVSYVQCDLVRPCPVPRTELLRDLREVGRDHELLRQVPPWRNLLSRIERRKIVGLYIRVPVSGHVGIVGSMLGVELAAVLEERRHEGHGVGVLNWLHKET